ncbi:septal ring lytic transglycosylase RlpA family protein [Asticcacaulis solisilvae]|uniref:septal ring lytic transglycosylase RlpA family protein n=1 Tax=Asticcacaulis solisilvae TaxID=1217274 RepID=UPI003FD72A55
MVLSACGSVQPRYSSQDMTRAPSSPRVASDSHYRSSTLRPYDVHGQTYYPAIPDAGWSQTGLASWYAYESPNRTTANGEPFDTDQLTAAHKTLPLPCIVEVENLDNGKTARIRVNDRGPFVDGRIIDLSRASAQALGVYNAGTARVRVTFLGPAEAVDPGVQYARRDDPPPTPAQPSDDALSYIVQIGAFSQSDNAQAARDRVDGAKIRQRNGLYLVYLGPYEGAGAAESHRQDAITAGFRDAILKREN